MFNKSVKNQYFFCHLRYNDYLPLDAAQWVAEVQCEPECIIRNIIDNTFYNKNVVVSNPEQPARFIAGINPTDFRDFSTSCLQSLTIAVEVRAENI